MLKEKFSIKIMPTPREISSSCGVSIRIEKKDMDEIAEILAQEIEEITIYDLHKDQSDKPVEIVFKKE